MLPARFTRTFILVVVVLVLFSSLLLVLNTPSLAIRRPSSSSSYFDPNRGLVFDSDGVEKGIAVDQNKKKPWIVGGGGGGEKKPLQVEGAHGGVIMSRLGNATAKAALGRATWKLMHTMTLRFPEVPTEDERTALESYFYLQSRLYPCGECAEEFQKLLQTFPPQTSSRRSAALWLCHVHNQVNARLKKPEFDCAHLDEEYDCGCGDEPISKKAQPQDVDDVNNSNKDKKEDNDNKKKDGGGSDPDARKVQDEEVRRDELTGAGLIRGGR